MDAGSIDAQNEMNFGSLSSSIEFFLWKALNQQNLKHLALNALRFCGPLVDIIIQWIIFPHQMANEAVVAQQNTLKSFSEMPNSPVLNETFLRNLFKLITVNDCQS